MKRILALLFVCGAALSLGACGAGAPNSGGGVQPGGSSAVTETPPPGEPDAASGTPEEAPGSSTEGSGETGGILIAYFPWSGNTEALAAMIQEETGGDLFAIQPETPYTGDYDALLDQAQQEQADQARPALAARVENWEQYGTIFVGYPNWWGDAPMVVLSFLESYDCTGKTVIPFCTSGGGGFGSSVDSVTASAAGAEILDGFHVGGSRVENAAGDVAAWIDGLGL